MLTENNQPKSPLLVLTKRQVASVEEIGPEVLSDFFAHLQSFTLKTISSIKDNSTIRGVITSHIPKLGVHFFL